MTLFISLLTVLMSVLGAHSQRTMADIEYELKREVEETEKQLPSYYTQYAKEYHEFKNELKLVNVTKMKFYSCDYDKAYDLCYILHEISYRYDVVDERSRPDAFRTEMLQRKIKRLSMQLEALRRLRPSLPKIPEVADSISEYVSDTLVSRLYAIGRASGEDVAGLEGWYVLDSADQASRTRSIEAGRRLIFIYKMYLRNDSIMADNYKSLRDEFTKTYWESRYTFRFLQKDFFRKHDMPFLYLVNNFGKVVQDVKNDRSRYEQWNKTHSSEAFWVIPIELILSLGLSYLIYYLLVFIGRKRRGFLKDVKNRRKVLIPTLNSACWLVFMTLDIFFLPVEFRLSAGVNILIFLCYLIAIRFSLLFLVKKEQVRRTVSMYMPITMACLLNMLLRLLFASDALLTVILCPALFILLGWQFDSLRRGWNKVEKLDAFISLGSCGVMLVLFIASFLGYIYLAAGVLFWWQCMIMLFLYIYIVIVLVEKYGRTVIKERKQKYYEAIGYANASVENSDLIQVTWFFEFVRKAVVPIAIVCALPFCIYLSMDFYNAGEWFTHELTKTRTSVDIGGNKYLVLSWFNVTMVFALFFVFRFAVFLLSCIYRQLKTELVRRKRGLDHMDEANLNYSIGNNLISLTIWASYIILICILLHIPMQSLAFIFAGLATGIGFALKDVINNMFYGIQLMAGRLQVGDFVVCDDCRGIVKGISYQTTQMLTEDGAMVNFGNADLFSKNFKNLTRHNPYEVNRVTFNVLYEADLQRVEEIVREIVEGMNTKDNLGRPLLSPVDGIVVEFREMGALSIEMAVRFGVIVQQRAWFLPKLRKEIFQRLNKENLIYTDASAPSLYKDFISKL